MGWQVTVDEPIGGRAELAGKYRVIRMEWMDWLPGAWWSGLFGAGGGLNLPGPEQRQAQDHPPRAITMETKAS